MKKILILAALFSLGVAKPIERIGQHSTGHGIIRITNYTCGGPNVGNYRVGYTVYYKNGDEITKVFACPLGTEGESDIKGYIDLGDRWDLYIKPRYWHDKNSTRYDLYTDGGFNAEKPNIAVFKIWLSENNYTITNEPNKLEFNTSYGCPLGNYEECAKKWISDFLGGTITVNSWYENGKWWIKAKNERGRSSTAGSDHVNWWRWKRIMLYDAGVQVRDTYLDTAEG